MRRGPTPEQRRARLIKRAKIITNTTCPTCQAPPGQRCQGTRGPRRSPHLARTKEYPCGS